MKNFFIIFIGFLSSASSSVYADAPSAAPCLEGDPCQVVFTLDKENNLVLEDVAKNHRREGVLRLTTEQAKKAALGPVSKSNIVQPPLEEDEFSGVIEQLSKVPGFGFLQPKSGEKPMPVKKHKSVSKNLECQQIEQAMVATLQDAAKNPHMPQSAFVTPAEVDMVCPPKKAAKINAWYQKQLR